MNLQLDQGLVKCVGMGMSTLLVFMGTADFLASWPVIWILGDVGLFAVLVALSLVGSPRESIARTPPGTTTHQGH